MNVNWLINMVLRRVIGKAVNAGINTGFKALQRDKRPAAQQGDVDAEQQVERDRIRAIRQARRAGRNG